MHHGKVGQQGSSVCTHIVAEHIYDERVVLAEKERNVICCEGQRFVSIMGILGKVWALAILALPRSAAQYREWCRAAPEHGKPEYAVCVPRGGGAANYMIEIVPAYEPGVELS